MVPSLSIECNERALNRGFDKYSHVFTEKRLIHLLQAAKILKVTEKKSYSILFYRRVGFSIQGRFSRLNKVAIIYWFIEAVIETLLAPFNLGCDLMVFLEK
jgi:hypothetical protein